MPLRELITASFDNELYSHIVLIPIVSVYFIFSERKTIFSQIGYSAGPGIILIIASLVLYLVGMTYGGSLNRNDLLSLMIFSMVIFWVGGFMLFYGKRCIRNAVFPLLFLVFMIPIPSMVIERIIYVLQSASAEASYLIFKLSGVPILREGFIFNLPGISIEVAKECSGIRSSLSLFITSIIAGHMLLQKGWKKVILSLSIFPITVMKNGVRIVTLSLLGAYVDERILTNSLLHRQGGILFFIFALALFAPILWVLRRSEKRRDNYLR